MQRLLLVTHSPSENTRQLRAALESGVRAAECVEIDFESLACAEVNVEHVLRADALILGTTENFGGMAGLTKDFFERIYYPCLDAKQGMPFAAYIRAGIDGEGALRELDRMVTGLRWRSVQAPLLLKGEYHPSFEERCRELGMAVATGLEMNIF